MPNGFNVLGKPLEDVWLDTLRAIGEVSTCKDLADRTLIILNFRGQRIFFLGHEIGVNTTITERACRDKKLSHSVLNRYNIPSPVLIIFYW